MIVAIAISLAVSLLVTPLVIWYCKKNRIYDYENKRKVHTGNIPRLGSVGFVSAFVVAFIFYALKYHYEEWQSLLPVVLGSVIIFGFGIIDDIKNLGGWVKFLVQSIAAVVVMLFGFRIKKILIYDLSWFSYPFTYAWIIGMVNSFNLIDGVDALCGGLSCFIVITIGLLSINEANIVSGCCFILAGALLGFLWYNKPKAKIFMGDGGSQFLGFFIAVIPLYGKQTVGHPLVFLSVCLLSAIPLFDCVAAMWRRTREHRSFFDADKQHIHHKLMNMGYKTRGILLVLYTIQIFLCTVVFFSNFIVTQMRYKILLLAAGYFAMVIFFAIIHYTNRAVLSMQDPDFKNEIDEH